MNPRFVAEPLPPGCPRYLRLAKEIERQMRSGVLRVGDRLPSVRQLRDERQVSTATAVACYLWLERQGYVRARPRSGFYVSRMPTAEGTLPVIAAGTRGPVRLNMGDVDRVLPTAARTLIDAGPCVVAPELLPTARLNRSLRLALSAFGDNAVRHVDRLGHPRLRRQIARLVFRQGASCVPDQIVVTSGATEALNLSLRAVAKAGEAVAVESPGCYEILQALEALQVRAAEVPHLPRRGLDLRLLASLADRRPLKAIVVTATCHNPMGDIVEEAGKEALVRFAEGRGIPIIESDAFGDLVFTGERPRPLKAFDGSGNILQCGSLSHFVAPGFNIGWANAGRWQPEIERLKGITNVGSAALPQLAMAEFLESGGFELHVRRLRIALWQIVEGARDLVLRTFPSGTRVSRPEGGYVLWIQLPDGFDGSAVQRMAMEAGVRVLPGAVFSPSRRYANFIRLACGQPFETVQRAIRTVAGVLAAARQRSA